MRRQWLGLWCAIFLGVIFLAAGIGKVSGQSEDFAPLILDFFPPSIALIIPIVIPYVEIIIGALLILGVAVKIVTGLSGLMIVGFIASNIVMTNNGLIDELCACFGIFLGVELTVRHALILDGIMAVLVLAIFLFYPGGFRSIKPWWLVTGQSTNADTPILKGGLCNE